MVSPGARIAKDFSIIGGNDEEQIQQALILCEEQINGCSDHLSGENVTFLPCHIIQYEFVYFLDLGHLGTCHRIIRLEGTVKVI